MMQFLTGTALVLPVNVFPLTDDTDFKSRETSVAYNASGMDLVWNFTPKGGATTTQTAVTPTTSGDYDWTHNGDGMYKIEIPASGGASINNDAEGYGWFTGVATGVLPWASPVFEFGKPGVVDEGTAAAVSSTTLTARSGSTYGADSAKGCILEVYSSGLGYKQTVIVDSNAGTGNRVLTIPGWPTATPTGTITYTLYSAPQASTANPPPADVVKWKGSPAPNNTGDAYPAATSAASNANSANLNAVDALNIVNSGTYGNSALKALLDAIDDYVDTEVAAIKAKTDNLPSDPADASDITGAFSTVNSTLGTIASYIDTEVGAIKTQTDKLAFTNNSGTNYVKTDVKGVDSKFSLTDSDRFNGLTS